MLGKLDRNFDFENSFSHYKNIFHCAGFIREEIQQQSRIKVGGKNMALNAGKLKTLKKLKQDLISASPGYLKYDADRNESITRHLNNLSSKEIFVYCQKQFNKLETGWKKNCRPAQLHKFRKRLKQFIYCSQLLSQAESKRICSVKKNRGLHSLQDVIGQWHDNILLIKKIKDEGLNVDPKFFIFLKPETRDFLHRIRKEGDRL